MFGETFGVFGRHTADRGEIGFNAGLLEAGLDEVLRRADEDARATADGGAQGAEVATGFGRKEEDYLLGLGGDGNGDALFADFLFQVWISKTSCLAEDLWFRAERRRPGGSEPIALEAGLRGARPCRQAAGWEPGRWAELCRNG
ncbi:hypothetical protein [Tunturiibacter gelidiferens]|uniref:hypothetical protein n=1 Tax=Tunturiibacter gelidiferens TaxID=3069689 RepID=UPI003D9B6DF0